MPNNLLRNLAEKAGFSLQNIRDEFDYAIDNSITSFSKMVAGECAHYVQSLVDKRIPASEYPNLIRQYFEIQNVKGM